LAIESGEQSLHIKVGAQKREAQPELADAALDDGVIPEEANR
jgi:hypothetical protein